MLQRTRQVTDALPKFWLIVLFFVTLLLALAVRYRKTEILILTMGGDLAKFKEATPLLGVVNADLLFNTVAVFCLAGIVPIGTLTMRPSRQIARVAVVIWAVTILCIGCFAWFSAGYL